MASFPIPSGAVADVSIIDSGARMEGLPTAALLTPEIKGFQTFSPLASYSFLIKSPSGKNALFDLGFPIELGNCPPLIQQQLEAMGCTITGAKTVPEVLEEAGVQIGDIESVIWSHHHWDHTGDIRVFPSSTEVVVGPGFSASYFPGYPADSESHLDESYTRNRSVREISFEGNGFIKIGHFNAYDFFGDGSFYLLDTPGHAAGHLAGLARTSTSPDTFILMGGDLSHHAGEIRPSANVSIPEDVKPHLGKALPSHLQCCLTGQMFRDLHARNDRKPGEAFFDAVLVEDGVAAAATINGTQTFDAEANIFVVLAHDVSLRDSIEVFPQTANDWKEKGWKDQTRWRFLSDLARAAADDQKCE